MTREAAGEERMTAGAQTLMRGLDVLEALADGPLPLAALSATLGLTRSTTHRLAGALVDRRVLTFRPGEGYSLGPKLIELGHAAGKQVRLTAVARPLLEELALETGDAVHLGVLEDGQVLYLDKVQGIRRVSIVSRVGERQPLASTGLGKALLLDMPEKEWRGFYPLRAEKSKGTVDLKQWLERMREYAAGGYAFDLEENEDQIRCIAAPVRAAGREIVGAISLSSAAQYMDDERMAALIPTVQQTADKISRELGWFGQQPAKLAR
jgi:DNA-binding IclR family transcriptional regulator